MNDAAANSLHNHSITALHLTRDDAIAALAEWKARLASIDAEIARRFGDNVRVAYAHAQKEHGTVSLSLEDGWAIKANITKRVKYDSALLMDVAAKMPWDRARVVFKIDLSVPEKMYSSLAGLDPELKKAIDAARTVETGEPKIELVPPTE